MWGAPAPAPPTNIKNISQKWKSQINVSSCPADFTPLVLIVDLHLYTQSSCKGLIFLFILKFESIADANGDL